MFEWLKESTSPYFWLLPFISAFVGGITSLFFAPLLARINQKSTLSSRAWSRIQDRRIDAFEAIIDVGNSLKETRPSGKHVDGHVETYWIYMETKESFVAWSEFFNEKQRLWENWVDLPTSQHMKYLVDYRENLRQAILQTEDAEIVDFAIDVKPDLISLAGETVEVAHNYFGNIDRKNFKIKGNGKYPFKKTKKRLEETKLTPYLIKNGFLAYNDKPRPS